MVINGEEIKRDIRRLGMTQKEFAKKANIPYNYLNNTLNGYHMYGVVIEAFKQYGLHYKTKPKNVRRGAA